MPCGEGQFRFRTLRRRRGPRTPNSAGQDEVRIGAPLWTSTRPMRTRLFRPPSFTFMRWRWLVLRTGLGVGLCALAVGCGDGGASEGDSGGPGGAIQSLSDLDGPWAGSFESSTGAMGTFTVDYSADLGAKTVTAIVDMPAPFVGGPDPDPETLVFSFDDEAAVLAGGATVMVTSKFAGDITITTGPDGTFTGSSTPLGGRTLAVTGSATTKQVTISYEIRSNSGDLLGEGDVQVEAGSGGTGIEDPAADCSQVSATPGVGGACGAECVPPVGGCIEGACLQSCIPGACTDLCGADELCTGITGQTFDDGQPFGVCLAPAPGAQVPYDQCGGSFGSCEAGSFCLGFIGDPFGTCSPKCTGDADCPDYDGFSGECVLGGSPGEFFCAIACDAGGDASCPAGMECQASAAGGNCRWPI